MIKIFFTLLILLFMSGCSLKNPFIKSSSYIDGGEYGYGEAKSSEALRKATMKPYCVRGRWYYPVAVKEGDTFVGNASWYGPDFHGKLTSNGERYNMYARTAASKTLPINTYVKVTNLNNGKTTIVRINDRGPFVENRIIDLSYQAAKEIGLIKKGVAPVRLEVVSCDEAANKYASKKVYRKRNYISNKNSQKSFFVQLASLYKKERAVELKRKYLSFYNKKYKPFLFAKNNQYKLMIGKFKTSSEAREFISKNGLRGAFVVSN